MEHINLAKYILKSGYRLMAAEWKIWYKAGVTEINNKNRKKFYCWKIFKVRHKVDKFFDYLLPQPWIYIFHFFKCT